MGFDSPARIAPAELRSAKTSDLHAVLSLLKTGNLPTDGVPEGLGERYVVVECEGRVVGVAGIERHGEFALLRSVVVNSSYRRSGIGAKLVKDRLAHAKETGAKGVYLLTTTAAEYFSKFGFRVVDREQVPEDIRQSEEYRVSCPDTATVMHLDFEERR